MTKEYNNKTISEEDTLCFLKKIIFELKSINKKKYLIEKQKLIIYFKVLFFYINNLFLKI